MHKFVPDGCGRNRAHETAAWTGRIFRLYAASQCSCIALWGCVISIEIGIGKIYTVWIVGVLHTINLCAHKNKNSSKYACAMSVCLCAVLQFGQLYYCKSQKCGKFIRQIFGSSVCMSRLYGQHSYVDKSHHQKNAQSKKTKRKFSMKWQRVSCWIILPTD